MLLLAIAVGVAVAGPVSRFTVAPSPPVTRPAPSPIGPSRPAGQPSGDELQRFIQDYYALLPGDTERAWALLGPTARRESNNLESYRRFYGGISRVRFADGPTAVDGRTVRASLLFDTAAGATTGPEPYEFIVEPSPAGGLVMSSFSR